MKIAFFAPAGTVLYSGIEEHEGMGTSDIAKCYVPAELAKLGHDVTLYTQHSEVNDHTIKGVRWTNDWFERAEYDILVCYRTFYLPPNIEARKKIMWSMDDVGTPANEALSRNWTAFHEIHVLSEYHKERFIEAGVEKLLLRINPPGVHYPLLDFERPEKEHAVCYASAPFKGLPLLASMWPRIAEENPGLKLHIFGDMRLHGAPEANVHFQRMYDDLKKRDDVELHPPMPQHQLFKEIARCKLMLMTSTYPETFGNIAQESIAVGTPVITNDLGAMRTTVKEAGMVTPVHPKESLFQDDYVGCVNFGLQSKVLLQLGCRLYDVRSWADCAEDLVR